MDTCGGVKESSGCCYIAYLDEKVYLLEVLTELDKIDNALDEAEDLIQIQQLVNHYKIIDRKIKMVFRKVLADEKSKSLDRYSRSIVWNRLLDGNYSQLDHLRATKI